MRNNLSVVRRLDGCVRRHTDTAKPLTAPEAAALERRRWLELLEADREGLADRLRWGYMLSTPEALALVPHHDRLAIARLDPGGRPFPPDVLNVALAPKVNMFCSLGIPALLERFGSGEAIADTDPALLALYAKAAAMEDELTLVLEGLDPTLSNLLWAIGWRLQGLVKRGKVASKTEEMQWDVTYTAAPFPLPEMVSWAALTAKWLADLREGCVATPLPIKNGTGLASDCNDFLPN